jgi:hypothetical protein
LDYSWSTNIEAFFRTIILMKIQATDELLRLLDDTPGHPYDVAWETAMLAPKAELAHSRGRITRS